MVDGATASLEPLLAQVAAAATEAPDGTSLAVVETTLAAGVMPPLHVHEVDEAFHVFEGSVVVYAGAETVRLEAGQSFVAPASVPHTHRAATERVRWLSLTFASSAGRYEDFVRAVGTPVDEGGAEPAVEEEAALLAFAAPSGIAVLGPPGMLPADLGSGADRVA
jgi:quercetin dioxygenase-like cupin family protein